jgi:hypothetical protein
MTIVILVEILMKEFNRLLPPSVYAKTDFMILECLRVPHVIIVALIAMVLLVQTVYHVYYRKEEL